MSGVLESVRGWLGGMDPSGTTLEVVLWVARLKSGPWCPLEVTSTLVEALQKHGNTHQP